MAGHGSDTVDHGLPIAAVQASSPAPGVRIDQITHSNSFRFLMLQRLRADDDQWTVYAYRDDGRQLTRCDLAQDGKTANWRVHPVAGFTERLHRARAAQQGNSLSELKR